MENENENEKYENWEKWKLKKKGNIPIEIGNLTNLKELNLSDNKLSGLKMKMKMKIFDVFFILFYFICEMKMKRKYSNRNGKSHKFTRIALEWKSTFRFENENENIWWYFILFVKNKK